MSPSCRWCGDDRVAATLDVAEMLHGTRERFTYTTCARCGSLSITDVPADLGRFYPDDYYARAEPPVFTDGWRATARRLRTRVAMSRAVPRRLAARLGGMPDWLAELRPLGLDATVVDVGSGAGRLVANLRRMGFADSVGIDPFAAADSDLVRRASIEDATGTFDVIMFHHSLEHVADPRASLRAARALLRPAGRVLVRLPLAGSEPARTYGEHWFAIDAPRHLAVPTVDGMRRACADTGFTIRSWHCDAGGVGWWGSELYRQGIVYESPQAATAMPESRRREFDAVAAAANRRGDGDAGVFVLEATP